MRSRVFVFSGNTFTHVVFPSPLYTFNLKFKINKLKDIETGGGKLITAVYDLY